MCKLYVNFDILDKGLPASAIGQVNSHDKEIIARLFCCPTLEPHNL